MLSFRTYGRRFGVGAVLALVLAAPLPAAAQSVVVPNSLAAAEGNSNNGFPFNIATFGLSSQRYQQVYEASQFSSISGAVLINQIAFRPDADVGNAFASVLSSVQINLSTTSKTSSTMSTTFAANVGANDTVVKSGALALSSSDTAGPGGSRAFDIIISLTTPFLYDPGAGNLLMDVRNFGGGSTTQFDAASDGSIGRTFTLVSNGVGDATGSANADFGLVTRFGYTPAIDPIPEPISLALFGPGLAVLGLVKRRHRETPGQ